MPTNKLFYFPLVAAAVAVYCFNWFWTDAATSLLVACLMAIGALLLIRDSLRILSECPC